MLTRPTLVEFEEYTRDYETCNTSFLYIAKLLKDKGVKNFDFMLIVKNDDVIGLDPYADAKPDVPDLELWEKKLIAEEVSDNYFYYLREIARIPVSGSSTDIGGGVAYELHRGNLAMAFLQEFNISFFVVLPRQTGKTWGIVHRILWEFNFATTNSQFLFMHLSKQGSVGNLKRLKEARELLPEYLQNNYSRDKKNNNIVKNIDNVNELRNANKNEIITKASAKTRIAADNLGRGMTQPTQFYDEFAFIMFNDIIWAAATPAFLQASRTAKEFGKPTSIMVASMWGQSPYKYAA